MKNGKGDTPRPTTITPEEWAANYELVFNTRQKTTTQDSKPTDTPMQFVKVVEPPEDQSRI